MDTTMPVCYKSIHLFRKEMDLTQARMMKYGLTEICNPTSHPATETTNALHTVMCLSIGTPKIINFPFVPNGKLIILRCPKI